MPASVDAPNNNVAHAMNTALPQETAPFSTHPDGKSGEVAPP